MQVVCYHKQEEKQRHAPEKSGPFRDPPFERLSERQRNDHAAHRDEQHGKVIEIPHIPGGEPYCQYVELKRPDDQP